MSYPNGTVISSSQTFPRYTTFGDRCVFEAACTFLNPCYFGDGCLFTSGCALIHVPAGTDYPPHETGTGCVFDKGCTLIYVKVGPSNLINTPSTYQPVSQGDGTFVGSGANHETGCVIDSSVAVSQGQVIAGCKVSENWKEASNPAGFRSDNMTVDDTSWNVP